MSGQRPRRGLWPALPETVLGRRLPARFRRWTVRFADPDRLLVDFVDWLESDGAIAGRGGPGAAAEGGDGRAQRDREELVHALIELLDRVPSGSLEGSIKRSLEAVGVIEFSPDGELRDPELHMVVGREPAPEPGLHDRIAATRRPGYRDGDRVLVQPEVVVYRSDAPGEGE